MLAFLRRCWGKACEWSPKLWKGAGTQHEQIKMIFTLAAAAFVIWQYFKTQEDGRVKQTMEFQSRFSQGDVRQAYLDLNLFMINNQPQLKAAAKGASQKTTELVKAQQLENKVMLLADFYGQVTTCVENGVCSHSVSCAVFAGPVVALRNNFYDLFRTWEKDWNENFIARSFEYFSMKCKA